jgi:hypothetical protein
MATETEIVFELEDPPTEVSRRVCNKIKRAERALLKRGNPDEARRALRNARQLNIKLISAVTVRYGLNKSEVKQYIGRDVTDLNDDLQRLSTEMHLAQMQQEKEGVAEIGRSTFQDIRNVIDETEDFHDLLVGIEEGRAQFPDE